MQLWYHDPRVVRKWGLIVLSLFIHTVFMIITQVKADWTISPYHEFIRVVPDSEYQYQNPPSFAWNYHSTYPTGYVIEVYTYRGGSSVRVNPGVNDRPQDLVYTFNTTRNWYLPTIAFPLGTYSWRIRPDPISYTSGVAAWSDDRIFTLDGGAMRFEVPDASVIHQRLLNKKRPRQLADDFKAEGDWDPIQQAAQSKSLVNDVSAVLANAAIPFPKNESDFITTTTAYGWVAAAGIQLVDAALLWRIKGQRFHLLEAFKRGDQLASLDPYGLSSYITQDVVGRGVSSCLMRGLDLLYDVIDDDRKKKWMDIIIIRTTQLFSTFMPNSNTMFQLETQPYDSHAAMAIEHLTTITYLALGETDHAEWWFNFVGRFIFHYLLPWAGSEGGHANGTPYGEYDTTESWHMWQIWATATGVNLFRKPYALGLLKQFLYFIPPHSLTHTFGDGFERVPAWDLHRSFAQRIADGEAVWYAQQLAYWTVSETYTDFLSAHYPMPYMTVAPKVPENAYHSVSIGWTAMHSDIADPLRTSIYFHAQQSPWGTYNHAHTNQNAFVLNSNGRQLLIESGYYVYATNAYVNWYHTTKATNAITYDGGIGIISTGNTINQYRTAQITHFSHTSELDSVAGDATIAYANAYTIWDGTYGYDMTLSSELRRLWYLRMENVVLVQDLIKAASNHSYEWNLHALAPITILNNGTNSSVMFTNVDTSLCITSLTNDPIQYITPNWPITDSLVPQYHGAFIKPNSSATEFLMLLDIGCRRPTVTIQDSLYERRVTIGSQTVTVRK